MPDEPLGRWERLDLHQAVQLFEKWPGHWWITGGVALELHLGRSWRSHGDSDVSIVRTDAPALRTALSGWDIQVAAAGTLSPWEGTHLSAQANQNNLWCRKSQNQPWCLDVTLSDGNEECWVYRRDPTLRVPWKEAVLTSDQAIPYLNPVLQLLFKSKNHRPKDDQDAREVVPVLGGNERDVLRQLLPKHHPWQVLLAASPGKERPGRDSNPRKTD